jgi:hypothetical protein
MLQETMVVHGVHEGARGYEAALAVLAEAVAGVEA